MKATWMRKNENKNLVIIFTGWAMSGQELLHLFNDDNSHDIIVFNSYRNVQDFHFTTLKLEKYENITLIAWSFGVFVANLLAEKLPKITKAVAINGSLNPVCKNNGIDPEIFEGTINNLTLESHQKFLQRICNTTATFNNFYENYELSCINDFREELIALKMLFSQRILPNQIFTNVIISTKDRIFPKDALLNCWKQQKLLPVEISAPHYPFLKFINFQELFSNAL